MAFYEAEQPREAVVDEATATAQFYDGLRELTRIPGMAANFGWCLAQLAGERDFEAQFRGMVGFLDAYQQHGLDTALTAIEDVQGIPIDVVQREGRQGDGEAFATEGRLVGLLRADERRLGRFLGIVCTEIDNSGEAFVPVAIDVEVPGVAQRLQ